MMQRDENSVKYLLTRVGAMLSDRTIYSLHASINYLEVGRWMRAKGYDVSKRFPSRAALFDFMGQQVADRDVLYMEFGVFKGEATKHWSKLLKNPKSHIHGFDSFEGLPEDYLPHVQKGHFSTEGAIPQIDDPRVKFHKGWFSDTLPGYKIPPHEVFVLNLDADLYTSTIFVLNTLKDIIVPGTYIYFDELNHREHEMKAFDEFVRDTGMKFSLVGVTRGMQHVAFKRES